MKQYANLHTHSVHSDGPYTPQELVEVAKNEGYKAMTISDHDTASAYPYMKDACEKAGLDYVFAVEFTVSEPKDYHMLGFGFDPEYPEMKKYLADMAIRQTDNTKKCFDEAVALGNIKGITWDEVLEYNHHIPWKCNNHVFAAMKAKGLVKEEEYVSWFRVNYMHQRGKYPPIIPFKTLPEMVALIKRAGGFAVVAHPHGQLDDIDYLVANGVEGLEVWHPDLTPQEQLRAYKIGIEKKLFISGGSDHSGLCGGYYSSFPNEQELKKTFYYIEPLSAGTQKEFFEEIKAHKLYR